jgi:hypothetical protein
VDQLAEWGGAFLDWIGPVVPVLIRQLGTFLDRMIGWFYVTALPSIVGQLAQWGVALVSWIVPRIPGMLLELAKLQQELNGWIIGRLPEIQKYLGEWADRFLKWVETDVMPKLPGVLDSIIKEIRTWSSGNQKALEDVGQTMGTALIKGIVNGFRSIKLPMPAFAVKYIDGPGGIKIPSGFDVMKGLVDLGAIIPALADGGIVTKPTLALIGEAGPEAVVPLKNGGGQMGGGVHVHFHGPVYGVSDLENLVTKMVISGQKRGRLTGLVAQT